MKFYLRINPRNSFFLKKKWQELCLSIKEVVKEFFMYKLKKTAAKRPSTKQLKPGRKTNSSLLAYSLKSPFSLCNIFFNF